MNLVQRSYIAGGEADGDVHSCTCIDCEFCNLIPLVEIDRLLQDDAGLQLISVSLTVSLVFYVHRRQWT